jgi:hypothetical protein
MAKVTNTTTTLNKKQVTEAELKKQLDDINRKFKDEKTVKFSVPEQFKKSIGSTLFIGVNGSFINIPVDGNEYDLPETFAKHAKEALKNLTI